MRKISVDFGTTNTVVTAWNEDEGVPETLMLERIGMTLSGNSVSVVPSVLYVEKEDPLEYLIGKEVYDAGLDALRNERFFAGFKRLIVSAARSFPRKIRGREFSYEFVGELFLKKVLEEATGSEGECEIIFTLPVDSFASYDRWIRNLCSKFVSRCKVHTIDEPTAAAIGYGVKNPNLLVLVVDFGGGTLDISLVRLQDFSKAAGGNSEDKIAKVVAKSGAILGGEDIDNWLIDDILKENGISMEDVCNFYPQLRREAERVKIALSTEKEAFFCVAASQGLLSLTFPYTRERLEELLLSHDFYTKIQNTIDNVLHEARLKGIHKQDIEKVLLVGGTCAIPSVRRSVAQNFGMEKILSEKLFEAVSHGALLSLHGIDVQEQLQHSYALRYLNPVTHRHEYKLLFPAGTQYPVESALELDLACSRYNQKAIELVIAEIRQYENTLNEVVFDGARIMTVEEKAMGQKIVPLNAKGENNFLISLDPPGNPGSNRLKLLFGINRKKQLTATVEDLLTGKIIYKEKPVVNLR